MKRIVIASSNPGKIKEFKEIFEPLSIQILSRADLNFNKSIEETGTTFEENAKIKATQCFKALNLPVLADDSGLEVEALNGKPGIFSARYATKNGVNLGNNNNNNACIQKILNELKHEINRKAKMVCSLCFINQFGKIFTITKTCEGSIATQSQKLNGFGFDCIFLINNRLLSNLTTQQKNKISHRGKAMHELLKNLETWWNEKI